jgi:hypothetical protein
VALGFNIVDRGAAGDLFYRVVDITMDNNYPAGGWPIAPKDVGLGNNGVIFFVHAMGMISGRGMEWDQTNKKLMVRDFSGAANAATPEITTVAQMAGIVARVIAWGKGQG